MHMTAIQALQGKTEYSILSLIVSNSQVLEFISIIRRRKWQPTTVFLPRESRGQNSLVGFCPQGCTESEATQHACMHALEKEMATHSSILAWRIQGTEEPGGLLSMGSHRVGHDGSNLAAAASLFQPFKEIIPEILIFRVDDSLLAETFLFPVYVPSIASTH